VRFIGWPDHFLALESHKLFGNAQLGEDKFRLVR
jgi:hypothetical protein